MLSPITGALKFDDCSKPSERLADVLSAVCIAQVSLLLGARRLRNYRSDFDNALILLLDALNLPFHVAELEPRTLRPVRSNQPANYRDDCEELHVGANA